MGKIPTVFISAMHINQAMWLFLADFHKAISFQIASQIARIMITGISQTKVQLIGDKSK